MIDGGDGATGFVVGLRSEAEVLTRRGASASLVRAVGGRETAAFGAADALLRAGARCVVSFGVCGGLDPSLSPGDLVIGRRLIGEDHSLKAPPWFEAFLGALGEAGRPASEGVFAASREAVTTKAAKAALFDQGAVGVDMESGGVHRAAADHGAAFLFIRAVVDDAATAIPPSALLGFGAEGDARVTPVVLSALRRPQDWPGLVRLGGQMRAALKSLDAAARILKERGVIGGRG